MKIFYDYNLKSHNTFGIDAKASEFVEYQSEDELKSVLPKIAGKNVLHIGGGSNLLFVGDFDGVVLHSAIKGIEVLSDDADSVLVKVGAAVVWDDFVDYAVGKGWAGAENLSYIPGEVGASAVQNIGAYGAEAKDIITSVETIDLASGEKRIFDNSSCEYGYRTSIFKKEMKGRVAVTFVCFRLSKTFVPKLEYGNLSKFFADGREATLQAVREVVRNVRDSKLPDPAKLGNAGSFFMNPVVSLDKFEALLKEYPQMPSYDAPGGKKIPAGWMIDQCGWKGKSLGRAAVHDKQALVIVNTGNATGEDIVRLSDAVRESVREKFGIDIQPEVNFIGK